MKELSKEKIKTFKTLTKEVLDKNGYEHTKGFTDFIYVKKTSVGTLRVTLPDNDVMYSVYMKFENDLDKVKFESIRPKEDYNRSSFKWNIHTDSMSHAIEELKQRVEDLK